MNAMTMRTTRGPGGEIRHVPTPFVPTAAKRPGKRQHRAPDPMKTNGESAAEQVRLLIERVERLEEEKRGIADDIKGVMAEAKSRGFDVKTIKAIIALRRMDKDQRAEAEMLLETYCVQLGLA